MKMLMEMEKRVGRRQDGEARSVAQEIEDAQDTETLAKIEERLMERKRKREDEDREATAKEEEVCNDLWRKETGGERPSGKGRRQKGDQDRGGGEGARRREGRKPEMEAERSSGSGHRVQRRKEDEVETKKRLANVLVDKLRRQGEKWESEIKEKEKWR